PWVSPVHCVPKKGGFTVVKNEENELIPTRLVTSWRVCIDYRKLNDATRKDHFPLPFMDQMIERLAGNEYYCFLDGIVLGHKISKNGIEVDKDKVDVIDKLPHPTTVKEFTSENSDVEIESFSPFPITVEDTDSFMEEIDLSFTPDDSVPPSINEDDYDSERDILILEELLSNDSILLPENESFHFDIPPSSRPPTKPLDDDSGILNVKVMGDIFKQYVPMPRLLPTQPTLASNQEISSSFITLGP
nr:reverse transcriptase domain-containing protein [Tanacetum cinerariifolium]